jgi:phospholipid/cholesterol/gamma-HCH transport system substrate-binding protein
MKKEIKIGIFVLAALVIFAYFIIKTESCSEFLSKGKRYPLLARFATVAGMHTSAPVRLAGVKIGLVEEIGLEGRHAIVRMMIDNRYQLLADARAIISTVGFVGEKYIEIVYKEEFNQPQPAVIQPGGEIQTLEPFNLDELKSKFDDIYESVMRITASIDDILSDGKSQESLRASLINLREISDSLRVMTREGGPAARAVEGMALIAARLQRTIAQADLLIAAANKEFAGADGGILDDLRAASARIEGISSDLLAVSSDLRQGRGTAGKLLHDEGLYKKIDDSVTAVNSLLEDLDRKQRSLSGIRFNYAVHFDYFTRLKKARAALDLGISTPHFLLMTGVNEDPVNGDPLFTALGGKKISDFTVSAGWIESDFGAALGFSLLRSRLHLDLYAYRLHRERNPLLKTMLRFSLSQNIHLQAGYYDLLRPENREFMVGISFAN